MNTQEITVAAVLVVFWVFVLLSLPLWNKAQRRRRLLAAEFPEAWKAILDKHLAMYRRMPEELKGQLHGIIQVLMAEKRFEGCGGLEVTDEMRVTILGQAAFLLLNRRTKFFPKLRTIYVYPYSYVAESREFDGIIMTEEDEVRLGESWDGGPVVLAWDDVLRDVRSLPRGHNVVLHEFAHQLDQEDGEADGAPILESAGGYRTWARVLGEEYERLRQGRGRSVISSYGAENPAEFFASATEAFFEKPELMREHHRSLYEELKGYYRIDPAQWPQ